MSELRRAATVLVLRPTADGRDVEVLFVRRNARASFMANAYVFPGGRVDDADAEGGPELASQRCAARELCEEAGLTVADPGELVYFARWVTPSAEPKRFDADFFLWAMPPEQEPRVDAQEVFDLRWYTPAAALAEYVEGGLNLPPPTACTLEDLQAEVAQVLVTAMAPAALLPALLQRSAARRPLPILPRLCPDEAGGLQIVLPWDPHFATLPGEGEPAPGLAQAAAPVPSRISRCTLAPPGVWRIQRLQGEPAK